MNAPDQRYLILIKHSLPDINPAVDPHQWELGQPGRERSELLANALKEYRPSHVFSSPESKAFETAHIVARKLFLPLEVLSSLHEHLRHSTTYQGQAAFHLSMQAFFAQPDEQVYGEETASQALERFSQAVEGILKKAGEGATLIVAHGTVISLYTSQVAKIDPFSLWKRLDLPSFVVFNLPDLELVRVVERVHGAD